MAYSIAPRRSLFSAVGMLFSFGFAHAVSGGNRAKHKLAGQVRNLVSKTAPAKTLQGEAVVFFTVDQENYIHVKGVFGTNGALIRHIEDSLKGKQIVPKGLEAGEEFQIKLKFNDLR